MTDLVAVCPICDGQVEIPEDTQETEILTCDECGNRVVVASINGDEVELEEAPEIEEDWGE